MRKQILIVGAGFSGMWAALSAARLLDKEANPNIDITVIAPQPELRVRPRFYENAVETLVAQLQPLFDITGVNFLRGTVDQLLPASKEVSWTDASGETRLQRYDRLVLASGSHVNRSQVAGAQAHAFDLINWKAQQYLKNICRIWQTNPRVMRVIRWSFAAVVLPASKWRWNCLAVCVISLAQKLRPEWS